MPTFSSARTLWTVNPRMSIPMIWLKCSVASCWFCAILMPPAFPRPPMGTCALRTNGYFKSEKSCEFWMSLPFGISIPYCLKSCFPRYSKSFMGPGMQVHIFKNFFEMRCWYMNSLFFGMLSYRMWFIEHGFFIGL